jgi:hypothetical protein
MSRLGECFSDVDFKTPVTRRKVIPYYPGDGAILAANEQSQTYRVGQDRVLENDSRGRLPRSSSDRMGWVALAYVWGTLSIARHLRRRAGFCAGQARSLDTSFNHGDRKAVAPIRRQSES